MKLFGLLLTATTLGLVSLQACGQDDSKLRNDPTYSTRNYKQPNKAATARNWEESTGVQVRPPYAPANQVSSYKNQAPNQLPAGGVLVDHQPNEALANRNYKAQLSPTTPESTTNTARKQPKSPNRPTVTGE